MCIRDRLCTVFWNWIWLSGRWRWTIFFEDVSSLLFYFEDPLIVVFFPYPSIDVCWSFCWEWSCFVDSGGHLWICSIVGLHRFDFLMVCSRYLWSNCVLLAITSLQAVLKTTDRSDNYYGYPCWFGYLSTINMLLLDKHNKIIKILKNEWRNYLEFDEVSEINF